MFFRARLPRSSKVAFSRPVTASWTVREITMPPAGASASKPGGDVHAIAIEIVTFHDQVAQVQAHAEHESGVCGLVAVGLGHGLLKLDGCAQRIDCAGELDQGPVASQLDQATRRIWPARGRGVQNGSCAGAPASRSHRAPSGGSSRQRLQHDRRQFALLTRQRHPLVIATESVGLRWELGNTSTVPLFGPQPEDERQR